MKLLYLHVLVRVFGLTCLITLWKAREHYIYMYFDHSHKSGGVAVYKLYTVKLVYIFGMQLYAKLTSPGMDVDSGRPSSGGTVCRYLQSCVCLESWKNMALAISKNFVGPLSLNKSIALE